MNGKPSSPVLRGLGASNGARLLHSYSLTFRICPPGQRLSAPLVPLERFAIRLKKRRIANQAIRIESTTQELSRFYHVPVFPGFRPNRVDALISLKLYGDIWRAWGDLNARPLVPETSALSN